MTKCENAPLDSEEDEAVNTSNDEEEQIMVALPVTNYDIVIDALLVGTINDLHEIARCMVADEFKKECSHVYNRCQWEFLEESLSRLGL